MMPGRVKQQGGDTEGVFVRCVAGVAKPSVLENQIAFLRWKEIKRVNRTRFVITPSENRGGRTNTQTVVVWESP